MGYSLNWKQISRKEPEDPDKQGLDPRGELWPLLHILDSMPE